jgi:hypothetical protein
MSTVNRKSLGATLDALNEAWFQGLALSVSERGAAARWIAGRQGLPGSYGRMFAPTDEEMAEGLRLFTGERIVSLGGARHIVGEEACRALILLDVADPDVAGALARASRGMMGRLPSSPDRARGMYCCARCSVALWRHLAVGGPRRGQSRTLAPGWGEQLEAASHARRALAAVPFLLYCPCADGDGYASGRRGTSLRRASLREAPQAAEERRCVRRASAGPC